MLSVRIYPSGGWREVIATNVLYGDSHRNIYNQGTWSGWISDATATPPQEYDLPLNAGFTRNGGCVYFKTQDGVVHGYGSVSGNFTQADTYFATLPVGFRSHSIFVLPATGRNVECNATITIRPDGTVSFWPEKICEAAYISFAFVAAA